MLGDGAGVDLKRVHVAVISRHHHIVPLVVVERLVGVALHERWTVAQVEDVMDVPAKQQRKYRNLNHLNVYYYW